MNERGAAMGQADAIAQLEDLIRRVQAGEEIDCVALRLFKPDGTWEDVAYGGTEAERAEALQKLREGQ